MKPQDVIKQLIGTCSGWDQLDTIAFVFHEPGKFPDASSASVDFEKGVVELWSKDETTVLQEFAIVATLEPITESSDSQQDTMDFDPKESGK